MTVPSSPKTEIKVRATVEKFDGNPPSKGVNALRMAALMGPKMPVEVITIDDIEGIKVSKPIEKTAWPLMRLIGWMNKKRGK